ncbi:UvrD-helicase domain-containing protein [Myxococcota bacterium]|nr:UvrD-helicase domain-containing protein [Myxococcota bacterium]MBU1380321.1 UvrD-helicase domain-containing protein [Myxococcota bacterium]MBU1495309.1 UvrD-helicase domain-containing protein [Myxococcota bacterium]
MIQSKNKIVEQIFNNQTCTNANFFLIEASAGTGKTHTMENIFTEFILQGVNIQSILAVTFTEKAASELSLRIYENLKKTSDPNGYLEKALREFQFNSIFTIHGFANKIINEFRVLAGIGGNTTLIERKKAYNYAFNSMIRSESTATDPLLESVLEVISINDLENIFIRMIETNNQLTRNNCINPDYIISAFLLKYIDDFESRVSQYIKDGSFFTYDDMISVVALALNDSSSPLLRALRGRYNIGIIDEFQDTDSKQWDIFRNLFCGSENMAGDKKLFLVGDPKQSIYGWRGADLDTYFEAKKLISNHKNGKILSLDTSYRSTKSMVQATNKFFNNFFTLPNEYPENIQCGNPEMKFETSNSTMELKSVNVPVFIGSTKNKVLDSFTDELSELLKGEYYFKKNSVKKRITAGDIFFLVRSAMDANVVEKLLREKNIPCFIYKNKGLFQSHEALGVLDVLNAVSNPEPQFLRKAFISDIFNMPLSAVMADNPGVLYENNSETIRRWSLLSKERRFSVLFHEIIEKPDFVDRMIKNNKKHLLDNYHTIIETLLIQNPTSSLDSHLKTLKKFYVEDYRSSDEDVNLTENMGVSDSVQILTIHKSKGLENKVVFLFGGYSSGKDDSYLRYFKKKPDEQKWWITENSTNSDENPEKKALFNDLESGENEYLRLEKQRLSYVAFTRSSAALFVPLILNKDKSPRKIFLNDLNEKLFSLYRNPTEDFRFYEIKQNFKERHEIKEIKESEEQTEMKFPQIMEVPDFKNRLGETVNSYSSLKKLLKPYDLTETHSLQRVDEDRGSAYGTLVHEFMERVDISEIMKAESFENWAEKESVKNLILELNFKETWSGDTINKALLMCYSGYTTLINMGNSSIALGNAEQISREMEFLELISDEFPGKSLQNVKTGDWIKGIIDLAFLHEGKLWIADWKTDFLEDYSQPFIEDIVSKQYEIQLLLYKNAAIRMLSRFRKADFGGIIYIFLRGLDNTGNGVWIDG